MESWGETFKSKSSLTEQSVRVESKNAALDKKNKYLASIFVIHFECNFSSSFRFRKEDNHSYSPRGKLVCYMSDPPSLTCLCNINIISFHLKTINSRNNDKIFANDVFNHEHFDCRKIACYVFYTYIL